MTELLSCKAKVYLAQGTEDHASFVGELDVVRAELAARGRDFTVERFPGADHGFRTLTEDAKTGPHGFEELFTRIVTWFGK